ncbi:MAG: hypothetical protein CM15mP62_10820 [Rhodospirillaceae bacterium]|nr:MAG: hypothetical protein CM15mP62_10820 [Rhodospirillaceae bacterium]
MIAQKVGMTRVFGEDGSHIPVTVLKVNNCQVVAKKTDKTDGYNAVQVGMGLAKVKRVSKQMRGHFAKAEVEPNKDYESLGLARKLLLNLVQKFWLTIL